MPYFAWWYNWIFLKISVKMAFDGLFSHCLREVCEIMKIAEKKSIFSYAILSNIISSICWMWIGHSIQKIIYVEHLACIILNRSEYDEWNRSSDIGSVLYQLNNWKANEKCWSRVKTEKRVSEREKERLMIEPPKRSNKNIIEKYMIQSMHKNAMRFMKVCTSET